MKKIWERLTRAAIYVVVDVALLALVRRGSSGSVLVVKVDALGDYVLFRNFLAAIREYPPYRDKKIVFCGNEAVRGLAEFYDGKTVDSFIWVDKRTVFSNPWKRFRALARIKRLGCSVAMQPTYCRGSFSGDCLVRASGAPERIGLEGALLAIQPHPAGDADCHSLPLNRFGDRFYTRLVPQNQSVLFEFERHLSFFSAVLPGSPLPRRPSLPPPGISAPVPDAPFALVLPGAGEAFREWMPERFGEVAAALRRERGLLCVVAGTPADAEKARRIAAAGGGADVVDLTGRLTLPQLAETASRAALIVCNDSAGIHLAAALQRPGVAVATGHSLGHFYPYPPGLGDTVRFVYPDAIRNSPLSFEELKEKYGREGAYEPISGVAPAAVLDAITELLGPSR